MSETYSPQAAAEQARDSFRKAAKEFETFKLDTTVPESVRALAEKTVNQSREAYERGKDALEEAIDALERSFDAAGQGATAFNRKLIDLAQRNLNSAFDLAKNLAGAKNLAEIVELQSAFIRHQFDVFASQASEIRALTEQDCRRHRRADQEPGLPFARTRSRRRNGRPPSRADDRAIERVVLQNGLGFAPRAFFLV